MGSSTTYRLRMQTKHSASQVADTLMAIACLPLDQARKADFDWWTGMPAMLAKGVSFSDQIPADQPKDPRFWSFDGSMVTLCVDLLNPQYRDDDLPRCVIARPNRQDTLLGAIATLCSEPEGTIVGGWQSEHLDDWLPLVIRDGRVQRGFPVSRGSLDKPQATVQQSPRIVDAALIEVSSDS